MSTEGTQTGVFKWFDDSKGYGFITPEGGGKDLFSHHSEIKNNGGFRSYLDALGGEPRIAWYPSAGEDFRDLLFLHGNFARLEPATEQEPAPPDIFLHTDYFPWSSSRFLDTNVVHEDSRTRITVEHIYGLLDVEQNRLELLRVAYDVAEAQVRIRRAGLPEWLAVRLARGQ